jgi:hypothetical protein
MESLGPLAALVEGSGEWLESRGYTDAYHISHGGGGRWVAIAAAADSQSAFVVPSCETLIFVLLVSNSGVRKSILCRNFWSFPFSLFPFAFLLSVFDFDFSKRCADAPSDGWCGWECVCGEGAMWRSVRVVCIGAASIVPCMTLGCDRLQRTWAQTGAVDR